MQYTFLIVAHERFDNEKYNETNQSTFKDDECGKIERKYWLRRYQS